jgi:hypothetical protein
MILASILAEFSEREKEKGREARERKVKGIERCEVRRRDM